MIAIDKLSYQSKLRHRNPTVKVVYALGTLALCVCTRWVPLALVALAVNGYLTVAQGGVKLGRYVRYMAVPLGFLLLSTLTMLVNIAPAPLDLWAVALGDWYLTASVSTTVLAVELVAIALASVSCLYALSFTTPMPDILWVLGNWHCPGLILELMLLIYRFIFVLLDVASAISIAQTSRLGQRDYKTAMKSFVALVSGLFIRAMKKSTALYDAMEARCYDGTFQVLHQTAPPTKGEMGAVAVYELALLSWFLLENFA